MNVWRLESAFICLHVQIAVLEEQKNEAAENEAADNVEDEAIKSNDVEPSSAVATKGELQNVKPDINDVPMEESQVNYVYSYQGFQYARCKLMDQ